MRVILQRCKKAKCIINGTTVGSIQTGYMLLVGFTHTDDITKINKMVKKILNLRVFEDENKKMNKSIIDVNGEILSISQFTLYANLNGGNRPSFTESMEPVMANSLYKLFNESLRGTGINVEEGIFGEDMKIDFINDGPVTITLEF
jgi:D-tyrosyl-tRNA(Tyr) deacylase